MIISTPAGKSRRQWNVQTASGARWQWMEIFPQNYSLANSLPVKGIFSIDELTLLHRSDVLRTNVIAPAHTRWIHALLTSHGIDFLPDDESVSDALRDHYGDVGSIPLRLAVYAVPEHAQYGPKLLSALKLFGVRTITQLGHHTEAEFIAFADEIAVNPWDLKRPIIPKEIAPLILRIMDVFAIRFNDAG